MALSALFLLKPFAAHRARAGAPPPPGPPGDAFAADIVASFMLQKTVSELSGSTSKLEFDIYGEIGIPNSTVAVNFLQPIGAPNWTNVIFSIVPYPKYSSISSMYLSILRASFMSLTVEQSTLHLTESLFGDTSLFEVLKFPGGITIIPPQAAFLLQKPYASFNFTLNFPIYKVQGRMNELKDQMKAGLQLDPYEVDVADSVHTKMPQNLYIKLTNSEGSTVRPPTIVQASIVLEVGNHQPSLPRMKQLAKTIANSSSGNLGLNHTVFGKVKQISLSSYLRHSLHMTLMHLVQHPCLNKAITIIINITITTTTTITTTIVMKKKGICVRLLHLYILLLNNPNIDLHRLHQQLSQYLVNTIITLIHLPTCLVLCHHHLSVHQLLFITLRITQIGTIAPLIHLQYLLMHIVLPKRQLWPLLLTHHMPRGSIRVNGLLHSCCAC
uniref:DUF7036 domain-containing protein n=1 Tax=Oryza barthii TaxID=65489 RepID=A0A0D3G6W9_9ORYZ